MTELRKSLGFTDLTLLAIGATIGSGIFLTPSNIAGSLPSPFWIMMVWVLGGVISLAGSLTYAELGAKYPGAGGLYIYLKEAYGDMWAFLYGWATLLVINTGSIAALALAFAKYSAKLLELVFEIEVGTGGIAMIAVLGIIIVTAINLIGVKQAGLFSSISTALKLLGIFILIFAGIAIATGAGNDYSPNSIGEVKGEFNFLSAIGIAMVSVLWSYGGWYHASFVAGEARDPRTTVPKAMIAGTLIITAVYLLTNFAYMNLLPVEDIANAPNGEVAAYGLSTIWGVGGAIFIAVVIFISTFGTTGIYTLSAPRIYYQMAVDGIFFKKLGELHPQWQTPVFAIGVQTLWAIVLVLVWGTFENLINYVLTTEWVFLAMAGFALFILRKKNPGEENQFKVKWLFLPVLFCTAAILFLLSQFRESPEQVLAGGIVIVTGIGAYLCWQTIDKIKAFGIGAMLPVVGLFIVAKKSADAEMLRYSFYGFITACFIQIMFLLYWLLMKGFSPIPG